jgi:hypothetical protein
MADMDETVALEPAVALGGDEGADPSIAPAKEGEDPDKARVEAILKAGIAKCKRVRERLIPIWRQNIDFRRAKASATTMDETERVRLAIDWARTKAKIAQLFSQVPVPIVTADDDHYAPAATVVQRRLIKHLREAGIAAAMNENLPDIINAAGFGYVIVRWESLQEQVEIPKQALLVQTLIAKVLGSLGMKTDAPREMVTTTRITDSRFQIERGSPADFLWDVEGFVGSDFDKSPFLGASGRMRFPEAMQAFGLKESDREWAVTGDTRSLQQRMVDPSSGEGSTNADEDIVEYDEVYYRRHKYHANETHFNAIQRVVFVGEKSVLNERWKGQRLDETLGKYVGATKYPIRVGTLNYISDDPIPPSDSAMGRGQVLEMMQARQDIIDQRKYAKPMRWFDVNRVDADIQMALMTGEIQGAIPVIGDGSRALGEIARAAYAPENFEFDRVHNRDLDEVWGLGANQMGFIASGARTAREQTITQGNFTTRVTQERAVLANYFVGIVDVLMGLVSLYDPGLKLPEPPPNTPPDALPLWDPQRIPHALLFTVRPDSTVILDAEQQAQRILRFLNIGGKSGYVDPLLPLKELAALSQQDPEKVIRRPQPAGPEPPNISLRLSGEDLLNPGVWALLTQAGLAPTAEAMDTAKKILTATMHMQPAQPPGAPVPPGTPEAPPMADDRPDWQILDRINSRRDASQNGG